MIFFISCVKSIFKPHREDRKGLSHWFCHARFSWLHMFFYKAHFIALITSTLQTKVLIHCLLPRERNLYFHLYCQDTGLLSFSFAKKITLPTELRVLSERAANVNGLVSLLACTKIHVYARPGKKIEKAVMPRVTDSTCGVMQLDQQLRWVKIEGFFKNENQQVATTVVRTGDK